MPIKNSKPGSFSKIVYKKNFGKNVFENILGNLLLKTFKHVEFCEVVTVPHACPRYFFVSIQL